MKLLVEREKRLNVIILIYMSFGLFFFGNIFNLYLDVFYFYELFYDLRRVVYEDEW